MFLSRSVDALLLFLHVDLFHALDGEFSYIVAWLYSLGCMWCACFEISAMFLALWILLLHFHMTSLCVMSFSSLHSLCIVWHFRRLCVFFLYV